MGFSKKKLIEVSEREISKDEMPLVSISCITYNHESYIRNAIDGFLKQKTTFPVEINIHDDASTDKTASIIREYEGMYPQIFNTIYQSENQFSKFDGTIGKLQRGRASGKYYAICEGDDYWTDPLKLQKQVDFLEANPGYSLTSHEAFYTYINDPNSLNKLASILYHNYKLDGFKGLFQLSKLFFRNSDEFWNRRRKSSKLERHATADFELALETASSSRYIPTLSIVARGEYLKSIPLDLFKHSAGHRLIILWTAMHGNHKHFDDVMGMKNTQESSVTVTGVLKSMNKHISRFEEDMNVYKILKKYAPDKKKQLIKNKIEELLEDNN